MTVKMESRNDVGMKILDVDLMRCGSKTRETSRP